MIPEERLELAEKAIRKYLSLQPEGKRFMLKAAAIDLVASVCGFKRRVTAIPYVDCLIQTKRIQSDGWNVTADV